MAENSPELSRKRHHDPDDANWASEGEMERLREVKRRREDREPCNSRQARETARRVGKEEARKRMSASPSCLPRDEPRELAIEGSSGSEFMSEPKPQPKLKKKRVRKRKSKQPEGANSEPKQKQKRKRRRNKRKPAGGAGDEAGHVS